MAGRVLFLSDASPLPQVSGDRIRTYNLMRQLAERGWHVSLYALVGRPTPDPPDVRDLESLCEHITLDTTPTSSMAKLGRLTASLVRHEAFHRRYLPSASALTGLRSMLSSESFDAIVFSRLYTYAWVPADSREIAVLDSQNVEERRIRSIARTGGLGPRSHVARLQRGPVVDFEREVVSSVRLTLAVSREECSHFEALAPGRVRLVPNGVNTGELTVRDAIPREPRILFVGSLDYSANIDAVQHLAVEILPRLRNKDVTVTVIGVNPARAVYAAARRSPVRMDVLGFVDDLRPHVEQSRCLVVPLRYGGGTRLKILRALGEGLPVLSTSLGCEGLELSRGEDVVVADDPDDFARSIERLCEDDELCARLSTVGRARVENHYDWSTVGDALNAAIEEVAEGPPRSTAFRSTDVR